MANEVDPKMQVLRKIDAHREVLLAEVDLLRYKLRPFSVLGSIGGWLGKALSFRSLKPPRAAGSRFGFDLDTLFWLGVPVVKYLLRRRGRRR